MARYTGPKCKLARREGTDLFLKSARRSLDSKCKLDTKPGQHGVKSGARTFGLRRPAAREAEAAPYLRLARAAVPPLLRRGGAPQGIDGHEPPAAAGVAPRQRRLPDGPGLDARRSAPARVAPLDHGERQGRSTCRRRCCAPATSCRPPTRPRAQLRIQDALQLAEKVGFPSWVEVDAKKAAGTFKGAPDRTEFGQDINESLVVELYSK